MLLEICVENIESALVAQSSGADRIELCTNLFDGGTTPPGELIMQVQEKIKIPVHIMIRPREGNFFYSDAEFVQMKKEIETSKKLSADGVVFGILTSDHKVDIVRTKQLVNYAEPMKTVFHRAFDEVVNPNQALEEIISCGIDTLLTSGQCEKAEDGKSLIKNLQYQAGNRINIMAGSGITDKNILEIARFTGIRCFHGSAKKKNAQREIFAGAETIRKMKAILDTLKA